MPSVLTIKAGDTWLQCPIGTMCQLGLLLPSNIVWGTLVLSALRCFQQPCMVMALTALVIVSTIFSGLNKSFNFLFSSRALFSLPFTKVILAAWALILLFLFLELWDKCSLDSPLSTVADVALTAFVHFPYYWTSGLTYPKIAWNFQSQGKTNIVPWQSLRNMGPLGFGQIDVSMTGWPH